MSEPEPIRKRGRPENLLRGPKGGTPAPGTSIREQEARFKEREAMIDAAAVNSPGDVIEQLFAEAAKFTIGRLRKMNRMKGEIPRSDIEVVRETRQLADRTFEIKQARGQDAVADAILAQVVSRMETVASVLERCARPFEQPAAG